MEFPEDVLQLIRAYSKPITNPNWRHLNIMPHWKFYLDLSWFPYLEPDEFQNGILHIKNIHVEFTDHGFELCHY